MRRVAQLQISGELFVAMFREGPRRVVYSVVDHPLPADAEVCGAWFDPQTGIVHLSIHSETFPQVEENVLPPVLKPPQIDVVPIPVTNSAGKPMNLPRPEDCICDKCDDF